MDNFKILFKIKSFLYSMAVLTVIYFIISTLQYDMSDWMVNQAHVSIVVTYYIYSINLFVSLVVGSLSGGFIFDK